MSLYIDKFKSRNGASVSEVFVAFNCSILDKLNRQFVQTIHYQFSTSRRYHDVELNALMMLV